MHTEVSAVVALFVFFSHRVRLQEKLIKDAPVPSSAPSVSPLFLELLLSVMAFS